MVPEGSALAYSYITYMYIGKELLAAFPRWEIITTGKIITELGFP